MIDKQSKFAPIVLVITAAIAMIISPINVSNITSSEFTSQSTATVNVSAQQWIVPSLEAFSKDYRTINVNWQKAGTYTNYDLEWSLSSSFTNSTKVSNITGTTRQVTGLKAETIYYFRIQAIGAPKIPSWSKTATAKTPAQAPTTTSVFMKTPDPHGGSMDTKGNLWVTDWREGTVQKVTAAGVVTNIGGVVAGSHPRGISLVNDSTAVVIRSYEDSINGPTTGLYTLSSNGTATFKKQFYKPYGTVYDPVRNKVFVSHANNLSECDYVTWDCKIVMTQTNSNITHLSITPNGEKVVMSGANNSTMSVYDIPTKTSRVLVNTPSMDVRGAVAIGNDDYLAASWKTGDVWRIQVAPDGSVSTQTVITGGVTPRTMVYNSSLNILYVGMYSAVEGEGGLYKYTNLIR